MRTLTLRPVRCARYGAAYTLDVAALWAELADEYALYYGAAASGAANRLHALARRIDPDS